MKTRPDIKPFITLVLLIQLSWSDASAQLFSKSGISFPNTLRSSINWVDLNRDGYLDLSISGEDWDGSGLAQGKIYLFGSDHLISSSKNIRTLSEGYQTWSDFNNDGSPDLLYAGKSGGATAGIDTFDVSLNYHSKFSGFTPLTKATADWGDFDNDGDYDVIIAGKDATTALVTNLYRNTKGVFTNVNAGLPGITDGKVAFIDYDLDQDLDIFISGLDINGNKYTRLWKNNGGTFAVTNDQFVNLRYSQFDWGDVNGDGYPDLIIGGWDETKCRGLIYINNAGNGFTLSDYKVPQANRGTSAFGDIDNDGDLDVFISGVKFQTSILNRLVFYNNGTDSLVPDSFSSDKIAYSSAQFADYDNDNVLDFAANGMKEDGNGMTFIGVNSYATPNPKPSVPVNLSAVVEGTSVTLSWDNSTDNNTPQQSITYNIYVGAGSNKTKIVSPLADLSNGFRRIARPGYIRDNKWILKDLPVGTYCWGVQAIDNSLGASAFSTESTFEISERFTKVSSTETPSLTSPAVYFDCDHDNDLDILLNSTNSLQIIENTLSPFTQVNYRTISANGYNPIYTVTPNDYDNNNRIDFSISGNYTINDVRDSSIALYEYISPFNYNVVNQALVKNISFEYVLWADLDNDGKQDFITSGKTTNLTTNKPVTRIYKNLGNGLFQKVTHSIRGFEKCGAVAGDFDNDLDIDLIIYGKDSLGAANTYAYINEGNFVFTEKLIPGNELYRKYLQSGIFSADYNLDGQLDIYMSGNTLLDDKYNRVLLNNSMDFTDANLQIRTSTTMSNFWADYDYDGDLDLFSVSIYGSLDKTRLYLNNNGTLEEIVIDLAASNKLELPFMAVNLDNKNGLDFLMKIGAGNYNQYYDNWGSNQRINTAPANTQFDQDQLDIILKWDKLSDCPACTYNIRVGTTPGGVDILSPMSDPATGYRYVVQPGNAYLNNGWKLCDLPVGTYYWSVQAVDPSNTGGPWSPEVTFTVSRVDADFSFTTVCLGDSTAFTDLSVGTDPVTKWKWYFGDGATSTLKNPKHLYAAAGTFSTVLWAFTDAGDSASVTYGVQIKAVPVSGFSANVACQGTPTTFANTTNTGSLTITNWLWNFGDGQTSNIQDPGTHGYLNPGDYLASLTVVADNGCSDAITKTVTVADYPAASVTADAPLTFCKGDSVTLSVPYNNKYTYKWMLGGVYLTGGDSSRYTARLTGNYTVGVVNTAGNCVTTSSSVAITVNDAPAAPLISAGSSTLFCEGDSVVLSVTNIPEYTYQWKLNGGAVGTNSYKHTAKSSGNYSLTAANSTGCISDAVNTVTVTVNAKPELPAVSISGYTTFCEGSGVEFSVTDNPALSYQWENNSIAITGATANNLIVQTQGSYSLRIINSNGCFNRSENIAVNVLTPPSPPLITASGPLEFCEGDSVILSVTNTLNYSYLWKLNGGATGSDTNRFAARTSGTYSLAVSNSAGCSANSANTIIVTVNPRPVLPTVSISGPTTFCEGSDVELSVTNNPAYTYQWENSGATLTGATINSHTAGSSGVYSLKITNSSGCYTRTENVAVNVLTLPAVPSISASKSTEFCQGDSVELSVTNTLNYTYQWRRDGGLTGTSYKFYAKSSGEYSLTVKNAEGCYAEAANTVDVVVKEAPVPGNISISGPATFCQGGSVIFSVPATTGYTYRWKNEYGEITGAETNSYTAGATGIYRLEVMNSTGCRAQTAPVTVTVKPMPDKPVITSTNYTPNVCPGKDPIKLSTGNTVPGYKYTWIKDGELRYNDTLTYIEFYDKGIYKLRAKVGECASESEAITITLPDAPEKPVVYVRGPVVWYMAASSNTADRYQWYRNGEQILGATKYIYVANKTLGTYKVAVGNQNLCYTMSDDITIPLAKSMMTSFYIPTEYLAGEDRLLSESIRLYPNPTTGLITIQMENNLSGSLTISIITEQGKEIKNIETEKTSEHFSTEIDLGSFPGGIYFISIQVNSFLVTRKVIVE